MELAGTIDSILKNGTPLVAVSGPNFSGRTEFLQEFCADLDRKRVYVGPEVYNALSGLTSTVRQELELHGGDSLPSLAISTAVNELALDSLLEQHPGTLSGGEQSCLAVLCGLALSPRAIAVDCGLEQLDQERLPQVLDLLVRKGPPEGTLVADNRLHEWPSNGPVVPIQSLRARPVGRSLVRPIEPALLSDTMACKAPTLKLEHLSAGYRRKPNVLRQLGLTLKPGVYSLSGPNGAGKSTLAKVLSGVLRPSAGTILVEGRAGKPWRQPGRLVAYHLQNPDVGLFENTVCNELRVGAGPGIGADKRVDALIGAFGLEDVLDMNPLSLPFPIRKRVSLAATLACPSPWYFLDEPALGADKETATALAAVITGISTIGHGVVVVSHSPSFHEALAGIQLRMRGGLIEEE